MKKQKDITHQVDAVVSQNYQIQYFHDGKWWTDNSCNTLERAKQLKLDADKLSGYKNRILETIIKVVG